MKTHRFIAGFTALALAAALSACGSSGSDNGSADEGSGGESSNSSTTSEQSSPESEQSSSGSEQSSTAGSSTESAAAESGSSESSAGESSAGGTSEAATYSGPKKTGGDMTFQLNWFPTGDHAPYYVAQDKGWYKDKGLNVKILPGSGSGSTAQRVGAGQADCGIADTGVVINAIRNGAKLTVVGMVFDDTGNTAWARKDTGITKPADLMGHTVGVPSGDAQKVLFPAFAEANDFDASKVDFVDVQPEAKYTALGSGRVDAILDAATGAPFIYKAMGSKDKVVEMRWADYGVNLYGLGIFCNNDYLSSHGGTVGTFLDQSYRGWAYTMKNQKDALEIEKKYSPTIDIKSYLVNLSIGISLMCTPRYEKNGIGWIDPQKMADTLKITQDLTKADSDISDASTVYTNKYLTHHDIPEGTCSAS